MKISKATVTLALLFAATSIEAAPTEVKEQSNGTPPAQYIYDYGDSSYLILDGVQYQIGKVSVSPKEDQTNHNYANDHRANGCNYIVINGTVFQLIFDGYEGFASMDSVNAGSARKRHDLKCVETSSSIKASN